MKDKKEEKVFFLRSTTCGKKGYLRVYAVRASSLESATRHLPDCLAVKPDELEELKSLENFQEPKFDKGRHVVQVLNVQVSSQVA